jgi:hypothetical protein
MVNLRGKWVKIIYYKFRLNDELEIKEIFIKKSIKKIKKIRIKLKKNTRDKIGLKDEVKNK